MGALARPLWHAAYGGADLALQAAVLAHGIGEGQLFIDANKRTALAALRTFLRLNGWDASATQPERADWIVSLARGTTATELAERLRFDACAPARRASRVAFSMTACRTPALPRVRSFISPATSNVYRLGQTV